MDRINILDASLADKIAAGEVVERPFSVVKELVENSIDAHATKIDITIVDGGKTLIEVKDNGCGMSYNDACLSIKRHATSKIHYDNDLFRIKTMGFRGEALSAISSVSKFTMITKEKDSDVATKLFCLNSEVIGVEKSAGVNGTTIMVEELFYNTPARLKYLKSDNVELSYISDIVNRLALSNPNVAFSLTSNEKVILKTSGKNDLLEVIASIYGMNVAKNMVPFKATNFDFDIEGYTSKITISKPNKYGINAFMNGRYVRNKILTDCIVDGYHEFLFEGRYPFTIINIKTDSTLLDVNVHPTKQEIRISKENDLKDLITSTINKALKGNDQVIENKVAPKFVSPTIENNMVEDVKAEEKEVTKQTFFDFNETEEEYNPVIKEEGKETIKKTYEVIGQIHGTYIIAQNEDGFIIVDQHAAAERTRYEKYKQLFKEPAYLIDMIVPLVMEFPSNEYQIIVEHLNLLKELHIEAEPFGNNSIKISSIPYYFKHVDMKVYIDECLNEIISNKRINKEVLIDYAIATAACKASLKANSHLSMSEMETILNDLFKCADPYTCPHGRPTMIKYTSYELEKFFKRVV